MEQNYIYVVILGTPFNTGKFIRFMTNYPYNHSGISFSPNIESFYSFARRYLPAPFYGGFVKESILRYEYKGNIAKLKIFAVPVSSKQLAEAKERAESIFAEKEEWIYNLPSAWAYPFKKQVHIKKSLTCVEFVLSMLKAYTDIEVLKNKNFCSIQELDSILSPYQIYEGSAKPFFENGTWEEDPFLQPFGFFKGLTSTFSLFSELIKRSLYK